MTEQKKKIVRGHKVAENLPTSRAGVIQTEEDRELVARLLREALYEYKQTRVKDDEELQARLDDYFNRCARSGQIPTVEEMIMCTGYTYGYMWDIMTGRKRGFSEKTSEILKKAKDYLKLFDAKLVVSGKLNFLAYCFRAKNYYGMSDKTEYIITPNTGNDSDMNAEEIAKRYLIEGSEASDSEGLTTFEKP